MRRILAALVMSILMVATGGTSVTAHAERGDWSPAQDIEWTVPGAHADFNTPAVEGCPYISHDGRTFFMASDRPGGLGGLDIWVSTRASTSDPWGAPVNAGAPINSGSADFCPTLAADGHTFFFVSARAGFCGDMPNGDIYRTRLNEDGTFDEPVHLGCDVNSPWDEHSPFPTNLEGTGPVLFYSSARPAGAGDAPGDHDLYMSRQLASGSWATGELVPGVSTAFNDGQPNVSRNGLELYFYSNRTGTLGGNDIYVSTRTHVKGAWGMPQNLGPMVNSAAAESRPSLSWDMGTLYFGSTRAGSSDVWVTTRP